MPTPSTVTASVSDPTPIPERPTMYTMLRCRGTFWDVGFPSVNRETLDKAAQHEPGSVVVTIPGSAEQASKPGKVIRSQYCCFGGCMAIAGSSGYCGKHDPAKTEPKDGSTKVGATQCMFREGSIRCYKYAGQFSDFCPDHTPAPTPKAEPATIKDYIDARIQDAANALDRAAIKAGEHIGDTTEMIPWPKDLNELVGKRITQRAKPRHRDIMGDAPESGVVLSVISTDTLDVRKCVDGDDDQWTIDYRDLLSIEPMPTPKPADEGKVESPADTIARLLAKNQRQAGEIEELKKIKSDLEATCSDLRKGPRF